MLPLYYYPAPRLPLLQLINQGSQLPGKPAVPQRQYHCCRGKAREGCCSCSLLRPIIKVMFLIFITIISFWGILSKLFPQGYTIIKIQKFLRTVQVRLQRISQGLCSSPRYGDDGKENGNYRGYGDFIGAIYG